MVFAVLAAAFILWGVVERFRLYEDTPRSFVLALLWAAGRLISASLNAFTGGDLREPFSARTGRSACLHSHWEKIEKVVDFIFFADPRHCRSAWISAYNRAGRKMRYRLEWIWYDR